MDEKGEKVKLGIFDDDDGRRATIQSTIANVDSAIQFISEKAVYSDKQCELDTTAYRISCKECCSDRVIYHDYKGCDVLFIHTSNYCSFGFMKNILSRNGCLIVCYSGGDLSEAYSYEAIRSEFPNINSIQFFSQIGRGINAAGLSQKWNLKAFIVAVKEGCSNPFDYLQRTGTPNLVALAILCQGYLAVNDKEAREKLPAGISINPKQAKETLTKGWWKPVFGESYNDNDLVEELRMIKKSKEDIDLIKGIRDLYKKGSIEHEAGFTQKVVEANGDLKKILSGKP